MKQKFLKDKIKKILNFICREIGERPTGSDNNQQVVDYARQKLQKNGYQVELQEFECFDWKNKGAKLLLNGEEIPAYPSYYTLPINLEAEYIVIRTIEELEEKKITGKITVLAGELTEEQIMPKSFPFYNSEQHQKIVKLLEEKAPAAIVTIVTNNLSIFEDGDFKVPSVYVPQSEGEKILNQTGKLKLTIKTKLKPTTAANVIARINPQADRKVVITAHLDTKYGTPGALDNGTGIAVLLALSSVIQAEDIDYCMELLLLNGEDYYSIPGQLEYSARYISSENISLAINCDGLGLKDSKTAVSLFALAGKKEKLLTNLIQQQTEFSIIDNWIEGDHMLFVMQDIPTVAFTSQEIFKLIDNIVHTEQDNLDLIDQKKLVRVVNCLNNYLKLI